MDLLYWNNTCPGAKVVFTKKLFYKKFLWRLVVRVPFGNLVYTNGCIQDAIKQRYTSVYHRRMWPEAWLPKQVSIPLIGCVRTIKSQYGKSIRIRVEEPMLQIYAQDEQTLKNIARDFVYPLNFGSCIEEINGPISDAEADILLSGAIIKRQPSEYRYKVVFRDGRYSIESKKQILEYLIQLGDQVRVSRGSREMLNMPYTSCWGVFFYTNDPAITTMIRLIEPDIIGNIHELIVLDK